MDQPAGRRPRAPLAGGLVAMLLLALSATLVVAAPSGAARQPASVAATSGAAAADPARTTALLPLRAPQRYVPPQGAKFNHWNIKRYRNTIRRHMLRTINSVPRGATIRWMVFSFGDWGIEKALVRARNRGVSVQVLGNYKNRETWAPWRKLQATFGTRTTKPGRNPERLSWARQCKKSCRGWGGNLHVKLYLFSQVATVPDVTMYGSWNPTWVANQRQWNHLDTRWDPDMYRQYLKIFAQAKRDRPYGYAHWLSGGMENFVFPRPSTRAATDPINQELAKISCVSPPDATNATHATVVRIGMYVFGGSRGTWMAKRIRSLWNQGCDVAIVYGFASPRALSILYSPTGRGRIPMKQAVKYENGKPYRYLHHKFVAIRGVYDGVPNSSVVWAGSTNFSNLGFSADDLTVKTATPMPLAAPVAQAYFDDFKITWSGPNVHRPHAGVSNPEQRLAGRKPSQRLRAPLGEGYYSELDAD
jgi:phosphatidylserine/phosphatidylglycerophosphate/cardiolipin synthase-like enzyme